MKIKEMFKDGLFSDGDWVESKDQDVDGDIRLIQLADIGDGKFIDKSNRFLNEETALKLKCTFLKQDDILVARMPDPLGRSCIFPFSEENKYVTVVDVCILRTPNNNRILPKYVSYNLNSPSVRHNIDQQISGATRSRITKTKLGEIDIPLPPIEEQKRIAAILDAADLHRQKTKALLDKYDELAQALFLEMFGDPVTNPKGWEKEPFEYFAKFDTRMVNNFEDYLDYPHIGIGNIEKDSGKILGYNLVKDEDLKSGKYLFDSRHIIYSKIRPNLNKVAIPDFKGLCSADSYPILVNREHTNRIFFSSLLRSKDFIEFILGHSTRTNIPKANKAQMKLYRGITPSLDLQNEFEKHILLIESQKYKAEKSLQKAEELFQSLLQKAFKGEL